MRAWIYLENGVFLEAKAFGASGTVVGEMVFNTSMSGYQEILTDPSYAGQFIVFTMPEIGIVGVNSDDYESAKIWAQGALMRSFNKKDSNFRSDGGLEDIFKAQGKFGVYDIDTRYLTKMLRDEGNLAAIISTEISDRGELAHRLENAPKIADINWVSVVSTKEPYHHKSGRWDHRQMAYNTPQNSAKKVAVIDYGVKRNILNELAECGLDLTIYPHDTPAEELIQKYQKGEINGVFLSNGPGEPRMLKYEIEQIRLMIAADIPMFGICLGHQLLSNAFGYETYKLKFGQHGGNHPVLNLQTKSIEITAQNHNYNVPESISEVSAVTHRNLFDGTIEGVRYNNGRVFSVQHHPEASAGPCESKYIFDEFVRIL